MSVEDFDGVTAPTQRINLNDAEDVVCDACGDKRFETVYLIKKLSKLLSPTGKDELIPLGPPIIPPIFACFKCGHVNEQFLPLPLRAKSVPKDGIVASELGNVGGGSNTPTIQLVK